MFHMIYSAISITLLLVAAPLIMGKAICKGINIDLSRSRGFRFMAGFMLMLALWELMAFTFMLLCKSKPFHWLWSTYMVVVAIICAVGLVHSGRKTELSHEQSSKNNNVLFDEGRNYVLIFCLILVVQVFETVMYAPVGYIKDDTYYYADINSTVYLDQLQFSGFKQTVSQWYAFISFIAAFTRIRPLILCRTILPVYLIGMMYITIYVFGFHIYNGDIIKIRTYLMWSAVIAEILSYSYYLFFLMIHISVWGKQVAGIIGIPLLLLTLHNSMAHWKNDRGQRYRIMALLMIMGMGAATMSFASAISGTIGVLFITLINIIACHRKEILLHATAAAIPFVLQLGYVLAELYG